MSNKVEVIRLVPKSNQNTIIVDQPQASGSSEQVEAAKNKNCCQGLDGCTRNILIFGCLFLLLGIGIAVLIVCSVFFALGIPNQSYQTDPLKILGIGIGAVLIIVVIILLVLISAHYCCGRNTRPRIEEKLLIGNPQPLTALPMIVQNNRPPLQPINQIRIINPYPVARPQPINQSVVTIPIITTPSVTPK